MVSDQDVAGQAKRSFAERVGNVPVGGLVSLLGGGMAAGAVDLATGMPSAPATDERLIEAACAALRAGVNQYENPAGNPELRAKIAAGFTTPADPATEVTVTVGGTEALLTALLSILNPGDEVVVFEPYYDNFLGTLSLAGAVPRFVELKAPKWRFEPESLKSVFGPRTKAVLLNSPHNPTGHMFSKDELEFIAGLCQKWNVTVISDEVYSWFTFDGREHLSVADIPALAERSIVVGSLSKSHALSGWRIGYLRAAPEITSVLRRVHIATTGGTTAPLQRAVLDARVLEPGVWNPAPELQKRRDSVTRIFTDAGLTCHVPDGGCYTMADIPVGHDGDCESYASGLVASAGVLVVPSTILYDRRELGERRVRIAFNKAESVIDEAERRLTGGSAAEEQPS